MSTLPYKKSMRQAFEDAIDICKKPLIRESLFSSESTPTAIALIACKLYEDYKNEEE